MPILTDEQPGSLLSAIEPLGQTVQVVGHLLQLLADGCALVRLSGALVGQLGNPGDLPADVFRDVSLLLGGGGHLLAHAGDTADRRADAIQRRTHRFDALYTLARDLLAPAGGNHRPFA